MKYTRALFAALLYFVVSPALAQWQVPDHSVPVGRGGSASGFKSAVPGSAGQTLQSTGTGSDPVFAPVILPPPSSSSLGGVYSSPAVPGQYVSGVNTDGTLSRATLGSFNVACAGTDDTASVTGTINAAIAAGGGRVVFPAAKCVMNSQAVFSISAGAGKSILLEGQGEDSSVVEWRTGFPSSGGFVFNLNNNAPTFTPNRFGITGLTVSTTVFQSTQAVTVNGGSSDTSGGGPEFKNLSIKGSNSTGYWTVGLFINTASRSTIDNYSYYGATPASYTEANMKGAAVEYSGNGDHYISNSHFTNFNKAVVMDANMEGVYITNTAMVAGNWCVYANSTSYATGVTFLNWADGHCNSYSGVVHAGWMNWMFVSDVLSLQFNGGTPIGPYIGYDVAGESISSGVPGRSFNFVNNTVNLSPSSFPVTGYKFRGIWGAAITGGNLEGTATNISSYTPYGTGIDIDGSAAISITGVASRAMSTFATIGPTSLNIALSGNVVSSGNTGIAVTGSVSSRAATIAITGNSFTNMATQTLSLDSCNVCTITGNVDSGTPSNGSWITAGTNASKGFYSFGNNWWTGATQSNLDAGSNYFYTNETGLIPAVGMTIKPGVGQPVNIYGGTVNLPGTSSGVLSLKTQAAAGTYNWNWPTTAGGAGQVMRSQGGGATAMDWLTLAASATTDTTNAANISSGTLPAARLPNPSASTLGGVQSLTCAANQWLNTISTAGVPACAQPAFSNLSGSLASTQLATATITALPLKASPNGTNDYAIIYDAAGSAVAKTTVGAIGSAGAVSAFNSRTGAVTPAQGDYPTSLIPGTTTNNNATAGNIGEYVSAENGSAAGSISSGAANNLVSVSLTAGDWDCSGIAQIQPSAAFSQAWVYISTTSATLSTTGLSGATLLSTPFTSASLQYLPSGNARILLASTTTVYLQAFPTFTSTATGGGALRCRRVR